jgi:copper chaperone CopZ
MDEEQKRALEPPMVARFKVNDLGSAVTQKAILDALQAIQGVCEVTIAFDAVHVTYDPLQTNEKELKKAIQGAGHAVTAAESELETPHPDPPDKKDGTSSSLAENV